MALHASAGVRGRQARTYWQRNLPDLYVFDVPVSQRWSSPSVPAPDFGAFGGDRGFGDPPMIVS
ncbi:MAG: hypothetical protein HOQ19_13395 [Gemmatimonadaceae bacterium]|nr:hypothetical protein [Gemmatimonadaceae bacterium]NUO92886.1 hypothetical protein [Gemmatimonadaceae bacterium]NUP56820.1 hypothetical protein [Gemmatimonadaceae bacterium]NUP71094.1 hypothetical protein [Gemmatimonadaceae bacterium]NUS46902.1 hypothetical protein [Gemmatimonadaceae bacterium]